MAECLENAVVYRGKPLREDRPIVMPKHKTTSTAASSIGAVTNVKTGRTPPTNVKFPELSAKEGLECRTLLEDQVLLIDVRTMTRGRCDTRPPEL